MVEVEAHDSIVSVWLCRRRRCHARLPQRPFRRSGSTFSTCSQRSSTLLAPMSGKLPPKGPRALLAPSATQPNDSSPPPTAPATSSALSHSSNGKRAHPQDSANSTHRSRPIPSSSSSSLPTVSGRHNSAVAPPTGPRSLSANTTKSNGVHSTSSRFGESAASSSSSGTAGPGPKTIQIRLADATKRHGTLPHNVSTFYVF